MKIDRFSLLCIQLFSCVFLASFSYSAIYKTFFEVIVGVGNDYGSSLSVTEDGGFLVCGTTFSNDSGSYNVFVVKFNKEVVEYAFTIGGDGDDFANWIESTEDGGFVLTGSTFSVTGFSSSLLLVKFDSSANIEWSVALYDYSSNLEGKSVKETSDGGYVVVGEVGDALDQVIVKFGGSGGNEWVIKLSGTYGWKDSCEVIESDDGYYVSGTTEKSFGFASLTKIFRNGSLDYIWTFGAYYSTEGYGLQFTPDGGLIQTGYIAVGYDQGYRGFGDLFLAKWNLEGQGELEWVVIFHRLGSDIIEKGYSIDLTEDEGYIITGEIGEDILLLNFDSNGDLQWVKTYSDGRCGFGRSLSQYEGGLVITGRLGDDIFISVVTKYGDGCGWETVPENEISSDFVDFLIPVLGNSQTMATHPSFLHAYLPNELSDFSSNLSNFTPNMESQCSSPVCFDRMGDLECSGHGTCVFTDTCSCEENYFGLNCEVNECFGVLSNETNPEMCSLHGECIDYNTCGNCIDDYVGKFCDVRYPLYYYDIIGKGGVAGGGGASDISETEDGGFVVFGQKNGVYVMKFFVNGSLDWAINLLEGVGVTPKAIIVTSDHKILFSINSIYDPDKVFVCKLSLLNGSVEWCSCVQGSEDTRLGKSIDETPGDKGVIISGWSYSCEGEYNLLTIKLDSSGNLCWAVCVGDSGFRSYGYYSQVAPDGGIIIGGLTLYPDNIRANMYLVRLTSEGGLDWAKTHGGGEEDVIFALQNTNDGGIIALGTTQTFGYGDRDAILSKFTVNGELEWAISIGGFSTEYGREVFEKKKGEGYIILLRSVSTSLTEWELVLASFDLDGNLERVSAFEQPGFNLAAIEPTFLLTGDGGVLISGRRLYGGVKHMYVIKTVDFDKGCYGSDYGWKDLTNSGEIKVERIVGIISQNYIPDVELDSDNELFNQYFFSPNTSDITSDILGLKETVCYYEFRCFGQINSSYACSGHGNCIDFDTCECEDSSIYFGNECEFHYCFDILNNDTLSVCGGRGKCVDHNSCDCDVNYGFNKDCTLWKCFGVWMNDTDVVCNGDNKPNILTSRGKCTSHDFCVCGKGYNRSKSCDWDCHGFLNGDERACGEYGNCIDEDVCNCTTDMYSGEYCETPTCAKMSISKDNDDDEVCNGHGDCIAVDECDCDTGYLSTEPGYCDFFTCFGVESTELEKVCSSHGECISYDVCDCEKGLYSGDSCELFLCGNIPSIDGSVCSGRGECTLPGICDCNFRYTGELCENDQLYLFIVIPLIPFMLILSTIGICVCMCVCLGCFLLCFSSLVFSTTLLGGVIFGYKRKVKRYTKLKHFDVLLQEQLLEEDIGIAHLRITKELFKIPYSELRIVRMLGEGGSNSIVYLAQWKGNLFAFKCYKTRLLCSSQHMFDEFEKEAQIASSVNHPHVVRFYGCCMDPPRVGIVMEYCEKGECFEYVHEKYPSECSKTYPINQRIRILFETAAALEYLHSRNIIHRDIKCENVFLNKHESSKVADFGLSKIDTNFSVKKTVRIGTMLYMSPELSQGISLYSNACDVFSFGIMIYILLTGDEFPYGNPTPCLVEQKVAQNENFRPSFSSNEINSCNFLIKKDYLWIVDVAKLCWKGDPKERPSFLEIMEVFRKNNYRENMGKDLDESNDNEGVETVEIAVEKQDGAVVWSETDNGIERIGEEKKEHLLKE